MKTVLVSLTLHQNVSVRQQVKVGTIILLILNFHVVFDKAFSDICAPHIEKKIFVRFYFDHALPA